jgi:outer membrane protein assembly factor BamA
VSAIAFDGRKVLAERELLAAVHSHVGEPWRQDVVERDELLLTEVAFDHGLITAKVHAEPVTPTADGRVTLRFTLEEGPVFTIGALSLKGVPAADQKHLLDSLETRPKQTFVRSQIKRDLQRLEHSGRAHGVTLEVTPVTQVDTAKKKVDITFELTPKSEGAIHF